MDIILPNAFENFEQNQFLINLFKQNKNIYIKGIRGSMPFSYFKDEVNYVNHSNIFLYKDMIQHIQSYNFLEMYFLDFSNPLIEEKDFSNRYCNIQFEIFGNYTNIYFIISNKQFLTYLINKYPSIKIILSEYFILSYKDEIFNILNCYKDNIKGIISSKIEVLNYFNSENFIKILSVDLYNCNNCNYYNQCQNKEQNNILTFSSQSVFFNCNSVELLPLNTIQNLLLSLTNNNNNNIIIYFLAPKSDDKKYYNYLNILLEAF